MDVRVKNKKTGEIKTVPQKVYETFKHKYKLIEDNIEVDQDIKKKELSPGVHLVGNTPIGPLSQAQQKLEEIKNDGSGCTVVENNTDRVKLLDKYSELSGGKKADGRWSDEKLKMKIEELKK